MIPIFIHTQSKEPDTCPECGKVEELKIVPYQTNDPKRSSPMDTKN